jgi:hypothetical protein
MGRSHLRFPRITRDTIFLILGIGTLVQQLFLVPHPDPLKLTAAGALLNLPLWSYLGERRRQ